MINNGVTIIAKHIWNFWKICRKHLPWSQLDKSLKLKQAICSINALHRKRVEMILADGFAINPIYVTGLFLCFLWRFQEVQKKTSCMKQVESNIRVLMTN